MQAFRDYLRWLQHVRQAAASPRSIPPRPRSRHAPKDAGSPEVTVVVPARNAAPYIAEALASALLQEGLHLEVVVVDDASTDGTVEAVRAFYDPRIRLLLSPTHGGIGHAHNRALEAARGSIIVHLDADDILLRGALRAVIAALDANPGASYAWAWHVEADEGCDLDETEFRQQTELRKRHDQLHPDVRHALLVHGMVTNPLRTYRREVFAAVGGFNERLPWGVDYDMAVRVADRFDGVRVPRVLYVQRVHGANVQQRLPLRSLRSWRRRATICHHRLTQNGGSLLGRGAAGVYALQLLGLAHVLGLRRLAGRLSPFGSRRTRAEIAPVED